MSSTILDEVIINLDGIKVACQTKKLAYNIFMRNSKSSTARKKYAIRIKTHQ